MLKVTIKTRRRRTLCFDLECRPLAFWYEGMTTSEITAIGWKFSDEPEVHTLLLRSDGLFVQDEGDHLLSYRAAHTYFWGVLQEADLVYGHNIRGFDLPLFQAHLLRLELPLLPDLLTCDTLKDYPKRRAMSASLENLAGFYGLEGDKLKMSQPDWEAANRLTEDGIALARERVTSDVLLQEQLRNKLLELSILKAPRVWRG